MFKDEFIKFDKFGVETVTFFKVDNLNYAIDLVRDLAFGKPEDGIISPYCEKQTTVREGLVCVPAMRIYDHQGKRIIVKIKARDIKKLDADLSKHQSAGWGGTIVIPNDVLYGYREILK